jgi:hypothetical protein
MIIVVLPLPIITKAVESKNKYSQYYNINDRKPNLNFNINFLVYFSYF